MQYIRLSEDYKNNILIPVSESPYKHIKNNNLPHFISMMKYNYQQYQQWQKTKSLKGMDGSTTNRIWADFDCEGNIGQAFKDCKVFVERLYALGFSEDEVQISFSGNKGAGVIVETENEFTIEQVKSLCSFLSKGLETFDTSMYDHQRIFRLLFTKNEKTGLYKFPMSYSDLDISPEQIKREASNLDGLNQEEIISSYKRSKVSVPETLLQVEKKPVKVKTIASAPLEKPRHWKEYKWQILQGNYEKGERHSALMVLASTCRGLGYGESEAVALCKAADERHCILKDDSPVEDLEENIIPSVYCDTWRGGQYSPKNNPWLKKYCERLGIAEEETDEEPSVPVIRIGDVQVDFIDYMQNIEANTVKTGIHILDEAMPLTTGMICGVVGAPSSGKTAIALKMLKNTSANGVLSVFASLDMHRTRLFQKLVMSETNMNRNELIKSVQAGQNEEVFNNIKESYKNVYFYDRSAASVHDIRKYIEAVQQETGQRVKFLMVDYFERLGSERSDDTAASKEVAGALQDLCNDMNLCIVVLVQPNKFSLGGGPDSPIMSYTAIKGSSFLYQAFRSIISIWRPFFTPDLKQHDRFLQMAILKNDLGELDLFNFSWNGRKGDIQEISEEEQYEMDNLLDEKNRKKSEEKKDDWG